MHLEVRALGGIERADIEISHVALIVGQTGAGKTSIIEAARAAASNDWHVRGITKKGNLAGFIHAGYDSGTVKLIDGKTMAEFRFPGCEYTTGGDAEGAGKTLFSTHVVAGIVNPLKDDVRARTQFFLEILAAFPTKEDLYYALEDAGLTRQQADQVWKRIQDTDWDAAQQHYATRATEMKGKWEGIAKDRWGSRKGDNFVPDGWAEELETSSTDKLEAEIARHKKHLESLIADSAVTEERRAQLEEEAGKVESAKGALFKAEQAVASARKQVDKAEKALERLPEPEKAPRTVDCPHCGVTSKVEMVDGEITLSAEITKVSAAENKKRAEERDDTAALLAEARDDQNKASAAQIAAKKTLDAAEAAAEKLKNLPPSKDLDEKKIDEAREAVREAEHRLQVFTMKREADRTHRSIIMTLKVVEELKPEGLRKRKLADAIDIFNKTLMQPLSDRVPGIRCFFDPGSLEPMMETARGIRHYRMLSRGEKLLFESMLQFAVAEKDGSSLVIIDDADAVTGELRAGLVKMALAAKTPSLIAMAIRVPQQVPDLSKTGKGHTYWIHDKTAVDVGDMKEAA